MRAGPDHPQQQPSRLASLHALALLVADLERQDVLQPQAIGRPSAKPVAYTPQDRESNLVAIFALFALLYLTAAVWALVSGVNGRGPLTLYEGGLISHVSLALAAGSLLGIGALLYRLPNAFGRPLSSPGLAWLHFLLLNAAFLIDGAEFHLNHVAALRSWDMLLAASIVLHGAWIAAFIVNLALTFRDFLGLGHGRRGPLA